MAPGGIIVSVLWDGEAVESIVESDGFLERLEGGIHVSVCTCSPEAARGLAKLHAEHGSSYIEAPVFGRPEAVAARKLWMPLAGPQAAKERVRPVLTAMGAQGIFDFGEEMGAAVMVKLVGNFLLISAARSMTEALATAEKAGVDVEAAVKMLTETLFPSPIYKTYGAMIAEKKLVFTQSKIPEKDLGLIEAVAWQYDLPAPIAHTIRELLRND